MPSFWKSRPAFEKRCERCDSPIIIAKPSHLARARFCSTRCAYANRRETNPLRQKPCVVCGEKRTGRASRNDKTCSPKCGYEWRKSHTRTARQCRQCGTSYADTAKARVAYCSLKCYHASVAFQAKNAIVEVSCAECGGTVRRKATTVAKAKRSFCSRECAQRHLRGEIHHSYRGDKDPNRGAKWNRLADSIRHRDCYSCRRCGLCQNGNGRNGEKLSVDHVRPWRSFTDKALANHPDNLVALCRACHSYKTSVVEAAWLRGDVLGWKQWVASLHLQSAVKFGWSA